MISFVVNFKYFIYKYYKIVAQYFYDAWCNHEIIDNPILTSLDLISLGNLNFFL